MTGLRAFLPQASSLIAKYIFQNVYRVGRTHGLVENIFDHNPQNSMSIQTYNVYESTPSLSYTIMTFYVD